MGQRVEKNVHRKIWAMDYSYCWYIGMGYGIQAMDYSYIGKGVGYRLWDMDYS
jgi:hypothetical protein